MSTFIFFFINRATALIFLMLILPCGMLFLIRSYASGVMIDIDVVILFEEGFLEANNWTSLC